MPDNRGMDRTDGPRETRNERRKEKRRLHEAHRKARAVEKENDRKVTSANGDDRKTNKYKDQAQKKTEKGKTDKAQKKVDKASRRRSRRRR